MPHTSKTATRRDRRKARDRQEVFQAAARLFAELGFAETGMAQIAEAADFSVGKLYTLFTNKEGLFVSLVSERLRSMDEAGATAVDPRAIPLDQLRQRIHAALDFFVQDPHFSQIFLNEYPTLADGVLQAESQRHIQLTAHYLQLAMDQGHIAAEDSEALAAIVNAFITGLIDLSEMRRDPVNPAWIMEYIERFLLKPLESASSSN